MWPTPLPALELITLKGLPLSVATPPIVPCDHADLLVAKRAARVVLVDGHIDTGVSGHLPDRGVLPGALRGQGHVRHPGRMDAVTVGADRLQRDVDGLARARDVVDRDRLVGEVQDCEDEPADHRGQQHERDCQPACSRHGPPPEALQLPQRLAEATFASALTNR